MRVLALVVLSLSCILATGAKVSFPSRTFGLRRFGFNRYKSHSFVGREDPDKEVVLAHMLFRHGHRTPADTYPNDPFFNETFYPYGWGQLTNPGKKYLFEMGEYLHRRYGDFLGKYYQPDVLHAQTTGVTRTRMSMLLVLAGLWPPKDSPTEWNKKLNWQPIPIESEPLDQDSLLLVRTPCARYSEAVEEVLQSAEVQSAVGPYVDMMRELTEITGLDIKTPDDNSYYYLLRRYLESVYPGCEARSTFLKLIQKVNELRKLNEVIIGVYLDVNPSQVEPLLREIFDMKNH
uniref:Uncharacterized protein n=1 Tax=Phlebotomus papatasi TaxID=29031 RepID=A0A1B0GNE6_PHLPP